MTFPLETLRELFRHMEWADATVWRAVLAHEHAQRDTKLLGWLLHIHVVQRAFLHVWTGRPLDFPEPSGFADVAAVHRWSQPYYAEVGAFLDSVDEARLTQAVEMPWAKQIVEYLGREIVNPTLAETMFQVTSHSLYHRGQANARLREIGGQPPLVDYIAWIWMGRPAPEHPVAASA